MLSCTTYTQPTATTANLFTSFDMTRSPSEESVRGGGKRKGTRSVSTLSQAQLERKRANDREAQRAIRARTKEHIERLEREVEDLKARDPTSRDPYIQELYKENRALREENARLRDNRHLGGAPYSNNTGYEESLSSVSGAAPSPRSSPFPTSGAYNGMAELGPSYVPLPENAADPWGPGVPVTVPSNVSSPTSSANTDEYGAPAYIPTSIPAPLIGTRSAPTKMEYDDVDSASLQLNPETLTKVQSRHWLLHSSPSSVATATASASASASTSASTQPASQRFPPSSGIVVPDGTVLPTTATAIGPLMRQPGTSFWEIPSLILPPTCAADSWMISFVQNCRRLSQTRPIDALLQPPRVNLKNFMGYRPLSPARPAPRIDASELEHALDSAVPGAFLPASNDTHPLTELIAAVCDQADLTNVAERLGVFVPIQRVLAWESNPTKESYAALPPGLVPRPSQLTIAHPQWVDLVVQGPLRDAIIERQDVYGTEEFQRVYAANLRLVNWPFRPVDALHIDEASGDMWLTDAFTSHVLRPENWCMGEGFARRYPELQGFVAMEAAPPTAS